MLTYWETLIAKKSNIAVSDSYAALWGKKSQSGYTVETYSGTLPATLQTVEGYLESYKIYGNTVQDGTPTPETPIMPSGCGESGHKLPMLVNGTVTDIYIGNPLMKIGDYADYIDSDTGKIVRQVKKVVLTGTETINGIEDTPYGTKAISYRYADLGMTDIVGYDELMKLRPYPSYCSTHFALKSHGRDSWTDINNGEIGANNYAPSNRNRYLIFGILYQTEEEFKQFLADQYAAETPVTIWYPIEEPVTEDPPAPFPQIPTAAGETTISWAGEGLAPSEVEFVYKVKR